jgi:serine/threonine protein phosphatase PrpC
MNKIEIMEYKFQEEDKFFIIASDGVWEFIESDEVKYY